MSIACSTGRPQTFLGSFSVTFNAIKQRASIYNSVDDVHDFNQSINQSMVYLLRKHNSNKQYHKSTLQRITRRVYEVLTGKTVRWEYELSVLAQSTIMTL